jgi:hypothetical protein
MTMMITVSSYSAFDPEDLTDEDEEEGVFTWKMSMNLPELLSSILVRIPLKRMQRSNPN